MTANAIVLGSTGLIGSHLASLLVPKYKHVIAPVRTIPHHADEITYVETDFRNPEASLSAIGEAEDLYYCLGTTKKSAGSNEKFRDIELMLANASLKIAKLAKVRRYFLLSSQGAKADSGIPYLSVKGEIEDLVKDAGFGTVTVFKPSLLVGDRKESRFFEGLAISSTKPILGLLQTVIPGSSPIRDDQVTSSILRAAETLGPGRHVLENKDMLALASRG